jgi:hypothetical protein
MSQPPGDNDRDEGGFEIEEPPIDPESDTKPLKALPERRRPEGAPPPGKPPPATVLQESPPGSRQARDPLPPRMGDTNRVRLIPRLPNPPPWRVILQATGPSKTRIGLDVRQSLVIGRIDPEGERNPDLDLTPHMAREHGVSRQHAVLLPTPEALYLADLESANGTWVNGAYLEPGKRHGLAPGDKVELGLLQLVVRSVVPLSK